MNQDDLVLVSVDDHLIEPPDMFSQVERRYSDRAPRVEVKDSADYWVFGDDYIFLKETWSVSDMTCELTSLELIPADV